MWFWHHMRLSALMLTSKLSAWNLIIVDERKRMRSAQSKTYDTLADFEAQHRLLVSSNAASQVLTRLLERTTYVASIQACHLRK